VTKVIYNCQDKMTTFIREHYQ